MTTKNPLKSQLDTALIAMKMSDQTIYTRTSIGREEALPEDQVYLHYQASQTKLKITKWEQNGLKFEEMSFDELKIYRREGLWEIDWYIVLNYNCDPGYDPYVN